MGELEGRWALAGAGRRWKDIVKINLQEVIHSGGGGGGTWTGVSIWLLVGICDGLLRKR